MRPATDATVDYKELVRDGYDASAARYAEARTGGAAALDLLLPRLDPHSEVLDLGCGCGDPVASKLAIGHHVTGVDFSSEQIRRAKESVPSATFIEADIASLRLDASRFDAIVAFYVIFHLPRAEQLELLSSIRRWLKPGGYFLATLSLWNEEPYTEDFFGVEMFWTNFALEEYIGFLQDLGFEMLETSMLSHGYNEDRPVETHPLVFARKPDGNA
jgi:ubiquinone/menaquinone biosynthesis C-methylase UbiE